MNEKQVETFNKWMQFFKPIIPSEDGLTDNLEEQYAEQMIKRLIEDILKLSDNPLTSLKPLVDEYLKEKHLFTQSFADCDETKRETILSQYRKLQYSFISAVIKLVKEGV